MLAIFAGMLCPISLAHAQSVFLVVDRDSGAVDVVSNGTLEIDGYEITSPAGRFDPDNWSSLSDQGAPGWEEANPDNAGISELNWIGAGTLEAGTTVSLGTPYSGGSILPSEEDVAFSYSMPGNIVGQGIVHYTGPSQLPTISVDRSSGAVSLSNPGDFPITAYSISSPGGSLNPEAFNGLTDQGTENWIEANPLSNLISELTLTSELPFAGSAFELGNIYTGGDLQLTYSTPDGGIAEGVVDFVGAIPDLVLQVDLFSGEAKIQNMSSAAGPFDVIGYSVTSASGSLSLDDWSSLRAQGDDNWVPSNASGESLAELNTGSSLLFEEGVSVSLGNIFGGTQDLQFEYGTFDGPALGTVEYVLNLGGGPPVLTCEDIAASRLTGDLNGDGTVDFPDFLTLSGNFDAMDVGYEGGDIDCDGTVGFPDFLALSGNFGATEGAAASVPEPTTHLMALLATLALLPLRKRQRSK